MILGAVMLGAIMGPIDGSIVNVVLPTIANYFQSDYALVQWVPTIYLLAICSFFGGSRVIPPGEKKPGQRLDMAGAALAFGVLFSIMLYANRGERLGWFF